jgi:hypothetical protein
MYFQLPIPDRIDRLRAFQLFGYPRSKTVRNLCGDGKEAPNFVAVNKHVYSTPGQTTLLDKNHVLGLAGINPVHSI